MSLMETQISLIAGQIVARQQSRATEIKGELARIENKKAQLQAELEATHLALDRLANFKVKIGGDFQCPACGIERGIQSALRPMGGGTGRVDFFRCHACNLEFSTEG